MKQQQQQCQWFKYPGVEQSEYELQIRTNSAPNYRNNERKNLFTYWHSRIKSTKLLLPKLLQLSSIYDIWCCVFFLPSCCASKYMKRKKDLKEYINMHMNITNISVFGMVAQQIGCMAKFKTQCWSLLCASKIIVMMMCMISQLLFRTIQFSQCAGANIQSVWQTTVLYDYRSYISFFFLKSAKHFRNIS